MGRSTTPKIKKMTKKDRQCSKRKRTFSSEDIDEFATVVDEKRPNLCKSTNGTDLNGNIPTQMHACGGNGTYIDRSYIPRFLIKWIVLSICIFLLNVCISCIISSVVYYVNKEFAFESQSGVNLKNIFNVIIPCDDVSLSKDEDDDTFDITKPGFKYYIDDIGRSVCSFENLTAVVEKATERVSRRILAKGAEERRIAIEKGNYHEGVPAIAVIADGGWSKRSHKHSYNALGGVGIIIGKETGKILYMGIRNKYCYICSRADTLHEKPNEHVCFKNWTESSQAMEADIIVEGFEKAETMHGVRYMQLVGDGDSSFFAKIREEVKVWGCKVEKIECANHVCKCLRSNLEKLVESNANYKGQNKLSKATRVRIVSAVRCAVRVRSKEKDKKKAANQMAKDIRNSIHHIFGNHQNCSDFCKGNSKNMEGNASHDTCMEDSSTSNDQPTDLCTDTSALWSEGSSVQAQDNSRYSTSLLYSDLDTAMLQDVSVLLDRVAAKSHRLIENTTTNLAECWMHMRTKFDGGKVYNICNRGSWNTRCYGGLIRMNVGPQWAPKVWQTCTGSPPGHNFVKLYTDREKHLHACNADKKKPEATQQRWKRKMGSLKESSTKKAKQSYGPQALDHEADITVEELATNNSEYLKKHIELPLQQIKAIDSLTVSQSQSQVWNDERRKRITASNFGLIVKRNPNIPVKAIVKNVLYSKFKGNEHTMHGLQQERITVQEYILKKAEESVNIQVQNSGLIIHPEIKYLAASPDGIVVENGEVCGLIEMKNVLKNKNINLNQAAKTQKTFCLEFVNGQLQLKENHNYYIQCQALLEISQLPWIDFIIRSVNPYQIHIERIVQNQNLTQLWLPKLEAFYYRVLLPELSCPREGKLPGIREPGKWFEDKKVKKKRAATSKKCPPISPKPGCSQSTCNFAKKQQIGSTYDLNTHQQKESQQSARQTEHTSSIETHADISHQKQIQQSSAKRATRGSVKFLGRRIQHEWKDSDDAQSTQWYEGTVLSVISGRDGSDTAVHEVLYDGDDEPYEIDHLLEDYKQCSLKFIDL